MSKYYGGLKQVAYSDTLGGARTNIDAKVSVDSTIEPGNTKNDVADGGQIFGGGVATAEILFLKHTDYDTIKGFMTNDTEKFWHFIFKDGHELSTQEAINPFARLGGGVNARDGVVAWIMDFERYSHIPVIEDTPAP